MLIRPIALPDSACLAGLHAAAFPPGEAWGEDAFARLLALPGTTGALAAEEDAPVGFVLARQALDEAELLTLAVLPERRRRGIGRALLAFGLGVLAERGV
ncbi:MAG: GNAT family N-acetyltransferase, partial [Elioraea sp.]|nr:GNAT family N-acetyltransferase [Elioraea sp.]